MNDVVQGSIAVDLKIDPDAFTIGDMALIMSAGTEKPAEVMPKIIDMMNRVVVGGVNHFPASKLQDCLSEVIRQWGENANPKA